MLRTTPPGDTAPSGHDRTTKWQLHRREFGRAAVCGVIGLAGAKSLPADENRHRWRYVLASCMYGTLPLDEILRQVPRAGSKHIDIWPRVHGNQREQIEAMGHERFRDLLAQDDVQLGMITRYDLGPARIAEDLPLARSFGARLLVTGSGGPKGLRGDELRDAVVRLVKRLEGPARQAAEAGVAIAIENHGNSLLESPDALRWFADMVAGRPLGIALAPYHLPQDQQLLAQLIRDLDDRMLHFYAWQHGMGCHQKLPKEQELLQMPGRGPLDFGPLLAAMDATAFAGFVEIFMHPVPRGIPIQDTADKVTAEINRARRYLDGLVS